MSASSMNIADAPLSNRQRILAILKASYGNLLEWCGFYFFGYSAIHFAPSFFPDGNPTTQLLKSTGLFAAAFVARPIGGFFYGRLADRQGRRTALIHSGMVMVAGSLILTLSPTYNSIGYLAPVVLLCARLLQGFSVGGGYGANATYMSEVAIKNQRGFLASFQYTTLVGGQLVAISLVTALQRLLTAYQLQSWGWRIPFAIGTLGALVSVWLRLSLQETSSARKANQPSASIKELLNYKRELVTVFMSTAAGSACFYTFTVYMQKYLVNSLHLPSSTASIILAVCLAIFMCLQPLFGALSDRIGRLAPMLLFSGLMSVLIIPVMYMLSGTDNVYVIFAGIMLALTVLAFYTSIGGIIKAELFPAHIRTLGVSLSYSVANAIFGGSAESIALTLKGQGMEFMFYAYLTVLCVLSFLTCAKYLPASLKMNYLEKSNT